MHSQFRSPPNPSFVVAGRFSVPRGKRDTGDSELHTQNCIASILNEFRALVSHFVVDSLHSPQSTEPSPQTGPATYQRFSHFIRGLGETLQFLKMRLASELVYCSSQALKAPLATQCPRDIGRVTLLVPLFEWLVFQGGCKPAEPRNQANRIVHESKTEIVQKQSVP